MNAKNLVVCLLLSIGAVTLTGCATTRCGPRPMGLPAGANWGEDKKRQSADDVAKSCREVYSPIIEKTHEASLTLAAKGVAFLTEGSVSPAYSVQAKYNQFTVFDQKLYYDYIEACQDRTVLRECTDDPIIRNSTNEKERADKEAFEKIAKAIRDISDQIKELEKRPPAEHPPIKQEIIRIINGVAVRLPAPLWGRGGSTEFRDPLVFLPVMSKGMDDLSTRISQVETRLDESISNARATTNNVWKQIYNIQDGMLRTREGRGEADALCVAALRRREQEVKSIAGALSGLLPRGEKPENKPVEISSAPGGCVILVAQSPVFDSCKKDIPTKGEGVTGIKMMDEWIQKIIDRTKATDELGEWQSSLEIYGYTDQKETKGSCATTYGNNLGLAVSRAIVFLDHLRTPKGPFGGLVPNYFLGGITQECEACSAEARECQMSGGRDCDSRNAACRTRHGCPKDRSKDPCSPTDERCLGEDRKIHVRLQRCLSQLPPLCTNLVNDKGSPDGVQPTATSE